MPSPSRAPPPDDRTPLLAQIDRSLSRSLSRGVPTRRTLGRSQSRGPTAAASAAGGPDGEGVVDADEFLTPTTLGEVVEGLDVDEDRSAKGEDDGGLGDGRDALSRRWKLFRSRSRY